jgi:hypothetical protein
VLLPPVRPLRARMNCCGQNAASMTSTVPEIVSAGRRPPGAFLHVLGECCD